jgi:malate dehydrogenase (oxaloacetate-decarboxylating)(NADP+)
LQLLVELGLPRENIWVTDIEGVVYQGRKVLMDEDKARFAQATQLRKLSDVIEGADIFLGLSAAGVLKPEMVKKMAARPLILALANPTPEIMPEQVKAVRDDAIIATGRSTTQPGQQRLVLSVYLSRRARRRRDLDYDRDGNCRGACAGRLGA